MGSVQRLAPGMARVASLWSYEAGRPAQALVRQLVKVLMSKEIMRRAVAIFFLGFVLSSAAQAFPATPAHQGVSAGGAPCAADLASSCQASPPFNGHPWMLLKDSVNWEVLVPQPYITVPQWIICGVSGQGLAAYGSAYCTIPAGCPINSTLSGSTCTCNAGYIENSAKNGCSPGGVGGTTVDILRATKASSCHGARPIPFTP